MKILNLFLVSSALSDLIQIGVHNKVNITDIENRQDKIQVGLTTFSALSIIAIFTLIIAGSIFYWLQVKRSRT